MSQHFNWRRLHDPNQERGDNRAWRTQLTDIVLNDDEVRKMAGDAARPIYSHSATFSAIASSPMTFTMKQSHFFPR